MRMCKHITNKTRLVNTLRMGDANLRLYAYKQFKYPVPNVLKGKRNHSDIKTKKILDKEKNRCTHMVTGRH
jgi:hypothetical protein